MAKVKAFLKSHDLEAAKRVRKCKYSGDEIFQGEKCLTIREGQFKSFTYSKTVALRMIEDARVKLVEIEKYFKA